MNPNLIIRDIQASEFEALGKLMIETYSTLEGFPTAAELPSYYSLLANVGDFSLKPNSRVLVAYSHLGVLMGGVVYFSDMAGYGAGGIAKSILNSSGIRLLGVSPRFRNAGVGKALTLACIDIAKSHDHEQVILHSTTAMKVAWRLYENLGFLRSEDLDFSQLGVDVFGFRLKLIEPTT
jgi:ribosomal protein S18 acetylase RimI-like enzyme